MQQGAVRSILLPNNTITRPEGTYRFRPCLLAYLILSGVAIVLASPNFLLDRSSTPALRIDLNHPPVGECSATPDQRVANQVQTNQPDGSPPAGPRLTTSDKEALRGFHYRSSERLSGRPEDVFKIFKTKIKTFPCPMGPHPSRKDHTWLPLTLMYHPDPIDPTGQVIRITSADRKVVDFALLISRFRKLIAYANKLHGDILKRCPNVEESWKRTQETPYRGG
ncbi:hypothetical protein PCANC_04725 [Puccinia coronata f. sp. avenae]|uniref:Uncharacterized protein n=1 Tax=Puccinia coronata f. sp. avenae TaxID=200324 RepID=A0A2N5W1N4_9BASI|nr:hypothetical protein PCANC_04725 [Puccinia coronata f. sp. avenae]